MLFSPHVNDDIPESRRILFSIDKKTGKILAIVALALIYYAQMFRLYFMFYIMRDITQRTAHLREWRKRHRAESLTRYLYNTRNFELFTQEVDSNDSEFAD